MTKAKHQQFFHVEATKLRRAKRCTFLPISYAVMPVIYIWMIPFVFKICAEIHLKNLPKGRNFRYLQDPWNPGMLFDVVCITHFL